MFGMVIGLLYLNSTRVEAANSNSAFTSLALRTATAEDCARVKRRDPSVTCVPGVTPFTDSDASGFGKSTCDFPGDAKQYLLGKTDKGPESVQGFAEGFACCLAKFIKAGESAGHNIRITSGYRSPAYQKGLFDRAVRKYGSVAAARKWVAPPGRSNHGRGIAADLNPFSKGCSSAACKWGHANAAAFGLRFRMSWEPWHIEPSGSSCEGTPGTVDPTGGDTTSSSPYGAYDPSASLPPTGGLPNIPSLGGGGGGSSSNNSNLSSVYDLAYEPESYGGDVGILQDDLEFTGDGAPMFESLLGDFGEFDEGDEVRAVLGYDDTNGSGSGVVSVIDSATSSRVVRPVDPVTGECTEGVAQTNIYGNIICVRNITSTDKSIEQTPASFFDMSFADNNTGLARTISTLIDSITPLRHLVGVNDAGEGIYIDGQYRLNAYDAYTPTEKFMYGNDPKTSLTEEELINFLVQENLVNDNPEQKLSAAVTLEILKPVLMHVVFMLYGTNSYAVSALLNLAYSL